MKKENVYKFLYAVSLLLLIGFFVRLGADYFTYKKDIYSIPFYVFILERAAEFIIPSVIFFIAALVNKKNINKK